MYTTRLFAAVALVLALAGCAGSDDGPGVATANGAAGDTPASASAPPLDREERQRQLVQCMRDNGVDMPDPEPGGGIRIGGPGQGLNPGDPRLQQAMEKCRQFMPNGGEPVKLSPEQLEQARKFAACMREHGIDFPDPDPNSGAIRINRGDGRINPESEQFQAAMKACESQRPMLRSPGSGS